MSKELRPIQPGADFAGMFLVLDNTDHQHYRTGQIVAVVGNCYLIQFDKLDEKDPLPPMELYTLEELSRICQNCGRSLPTCSRPALIWSGGSPGSTSRRSRQDNPVRWCI